MPAPGGPESTSDLVAGLMRQGLELWIDGEQLRVRAPRGALTKDVRAVLSRRRAEVLEFLRSQRSSIEITPDPEDRYAPFPLTDLQQSYWLGQTDAFELGNVKPHVYSELEFAGLDLDRVRTVLRRLVERHDALRSVVLPSGAQVTLEQAPDWDFPCTDLTGLDEASRRHALAKVRDEMSRAFTSTGSWPPFEVCAHRLPGDRVRFHVSICLLTIDGTSVRILAEEIRTLYREPGAELVAHRSSFRDYVRAAEAFRGTAAYRRQERFWRDRLADLPPAPELPLARAPGSIDQPFLRRRSARFDTESWAGFQRHARTAGVFRAAALCAAYCTVLARWSKAPRFTVNILDSQRPAANGADASVIGNYSATTLTAIDAAAPRTFAEFAVQIQARRLVDRQHGAVSGVWVLRELNRLHGTSSRASMPVVFNSLDSVLEADEDLLGNEVVGSLQTPQVMLDHLVVARGRGLELHWDALEEVFPDGVLDVMFEAYRTLVSRLSTDPAAWRLPLHALVTAPRAARPARRREIRDLRLCDDVWRALERAPDRLAVVDPTRSLTYRELLQRANDLTGWLRRRGAAPDRLVAVVMHKGWEQVAAVLAVHGAGAPYLPIDATLPGERIRQLLARGGVRLALTQPSVDATVDWPPSVERRVVQAPDSPSDVGSLPTRPDAGGAGSDLAYVIFTSGSTGEPKGVMIHHRSALNTVDDINARFGVGGSDRVLAVSSLGFDLSVYDVFGLLGVGGTVVVPTSEDVRDPERLAAWLHGQHVTIWNSVPATMGILVEFLEGRGERLPRSLRLVLLSGDWVPVTLPERIRRISANARVVSLGGATEASIWSIAYPVEQVDPRWTSIPYGTPLANQRVDVLSETLEPCPTWVAGELYIAGAGLSLGYLGDPAQTAARFVLHPRTGERLYRTGDWGRYLPDGNIEFLGRDDLQVKVRGFRVELGEIEAVLGRHPAVRAAVVSAIAAGTGAKRLAAYVVPKQPGTAPAELRAYLAQRLPSYMVPASVTFLPELPLTANGKVDRKRLPAPERALPATPAAGPPSALEARLRELWEEVLQRRPVGVSDNFFDLGGDSMSALRLSTLVERKLGHRITVSQLLRAPSVAGMAELVGRASTPPADCLVPVLDRASGRPLALVHPVGGNVVCYRVLAEFLPDHSVWGVQAGEGTAPTTLEDMAARYVGELRRARLGPPWLLGGWSMGGMLAAAMAVQMADSGERVDGVVLLDSLLPPEDIPLDEPWLVERFLADLGAPAEVCRRGAEWARAGGPEAALGRTLTEFDFGAADVHQAVALFGVFARNQRALARHTPKPVPAPLLLVRASQPSFAGWRDPGPALCTASPHVETSEVEASHFTLLTEPAVGRLARVVADFLSRVSKESAA
jgi:pyochelin synthetase